MEQNPPHEKCDDVVGSRRIQKSLDLDLLTHGNQAATDLQRGKMFENLGSSWLEWRCQRRGKEKAQSLDGGRVVGCQVGSGPSGTSTTPSTTSIVIRWGRMIIKLKRNLVQNLNHRSHSWCPYQWKNSPSSRSSSSQSRMLVAGRCKDFNLIQCETARNLTKVIIDWHLLFPLFESCGKEGGLNEPLQLRSGKNEPSSCASVSETYLAQHWRIINAGGDGRGNLFGET